MQKSLSLAFLFLLLLVACDNKSPNSANSLTPHEVAALVRSLTQVELPSGATDVYGDAKSLFTETAVVRFECSAEALRAFLHSSPVLEDELITGKRAVQASMNGNSWWQPDLLALVSGSDQSWRSPNGMVSAQLMAGEAGVPGKVVVYICATTER